MATARRALATFRLDPATVEDMVDDFLATKLEVLARDETRVPEALFYTAITRVAIDHTRAADVRRRHHAAIKHEERDKERDDVEAVALGDDSLALRRLDTLLARLPERHRRILLATEAGENREEFARAEGTSRDNIDHIASRARKRVRKEWDAMESAGEDADPPERPERPERPGAGRERRDEREGSAAGSARTENPPR